MLRILVYARDFLDRSELLRLLEAFGDCDAATSEEECMEALLAALRCQRPYDLVTVDWELEIGSRRPLEEGIRHLEQAGALPQGKGSKLLLTLPKGHDLARVRAAAGPWDGILVRPVDAEVLSQKLRDLGLEGHG